MEVAQVFSRAKSTLAQEVFETVEILFGLEAKLLWFYYQMMQAGNLDIDQFLHVHNAMSRPHEMATRQKAK